MKKINIAFCFDENMWMQAGVCITSLLEVAQNKCNYHIYCVVSDTVLAGARETLENLVHRLSPLSEITFLRPSSDFDAADASHFTSAIYYRLMLPNLLPELDKIIYSDVDVIFCDPLLEADSLDIGGNLVAAVKDAVNSKALWTARNPQKIFPALKRGEYVYSGFLVMNLKAMREMNLYKEMVSSALSQRLSYPDQDVLNLLCAGKVHFLPPKYVFCPWEDSLYETCISEGIYTRAEFEEARSAPAIIHYADTKPWNARTGLDEYWWRCAKRAGFYEEFCVKFLVPDRSCVQKLLLFGVPLFTFIKEEKKTLLLLFGKIEIFKILRR